MGLIASTLPTYFLSRLIASFCVPYYLADPTNRWGEFTHDYLPSWAVIEPGPALTWFFEGLPRGAPVPWEVWIGPLFWWLSLLAALCAVLLCTAVILRKQWIEYERLDYALMELPLAMVEEGDTPSRLPPFMRSPLFWMGFSFSIFGILWNIVSYFNPTFPVFPWRFESISFGRDFQPIRMNLYWPIVGFAYFINLDISFSICFFYLLAVIEEGLFNRFGVTISEANFAGTSFVPVGWQMIGVWFTVVGWGLWIARSHLRDVFRKAFKGDAKIDDSDELLSYRGAVFGLLYGLLYMACWLYASGMGLWVIAVFLVVMMVVYIGISRIIAETGVITIRAVMVPQTFIMFTFGTTRLSAQTMVALGMSYGWCGDMKTTLMPALTHSVRLFDTIQHHKRQLVWALCLAMGVGIVASCLYIISMGYEGGAGNYGSQISGGLARRTLGLCGQIRKRSRQSRLAQNGLLHQRHRLRCPPVLLALPLHLVAPAPTGTGNRTCVSRDPCRLPNIPRLVEQIRDPAFWRQQNLSQCPPLLPRIDHGILRGRGHLVLCRYDLVLRARTRRSIFRLILALY